MSDPKPLRASTPTELTGDSEYQRLLGRISEVYTTGQVPAHQAVNARLPDRDELRRELERTLQIAEERARDAPEAGGP